MILAAGLLPTLTACAGNIQTSDLSLVWEKGSALTYDFTQTEQGDITTPNSGTRTGVSGVHAQIKIDVVDANPAGGTASLKLNVNDFTTSEVGQPATAPGAANLFAATDTRGAVSSSDRTPILGGFEYAQDFLPAPVLPDHQVREGDSWTVTYDQPRLTPIDVQHHQDRESLIRIDRSQGVIALIEGDYSIPVGSTQNFPLPGQLGAGLRTTISGASWKGMTTGHISTWVDLDHRVIKRQIREEIDELDASPANGASGSASLGRSSLHNVYTFALRG